jgi:hypothetical protein
VCDAQYFAHFPAQSKSNVAGARASLNISQFC